jgi:hypothetical protein
MTTRQELDRSISAWLEAEAPRRAPDDVLEASRDRIRNTRQRRFWWPAWRPSDMNTFAKLLVATAAVAVVAVVGINLLPGGGSGAGGVPPSPSISPTVPPSPSMSPTPQPTASLVAHSFTPFGPGGIDDQDPRAASITFTFDTPAAWEPFGLGGSDPGPGEALGVWIEGNGPPDGATLAFYRGSGLFSDPCLTEQEADAAADVPVGPTVDDLVTALVDHPSLDVSSPVDVTLAGYSGKYLDLQVPDDISACAYYRPMDVHIYAQGPGQRWHMWVLDVGGVRVLVETNDYAGTSAQRLAEEQAIIESLVITP